MTVEEYVSGLLTSTPNVADLIGTRVFPSQAPESSDFPLVIYQEADRKTVMTHSGPVDLDSYVMDLACVGSDYASVKSLAKQVRKALNGRRGEDKGFALLGVFDQTESDEHEVPEHADERGIFSVSMSLNLWFRPDAN